MGIQSGLGLEAAKIIAGLSPARLILAVRDLNKGEDAKRSIRTIAPSLSESAIEVWELNMLVFASVRSFANRATVELDRLDVVILNAGVYKLKFEEHAGGEETICVNVVSTIMLAILLLPKLRDSSEESPTQPVVTIVGSELYSIASFPEKKAPSIFKAFNDKIGTNMESRYAKVGQTQSGADNVLVKIQYIKARPDAGFPFS